MPMRNRSGHRDRRGRESRGRVAASLAGGLVAACVAVASAAPPARAAEGAAPPPDVPFSLTLEPFALAGFPGLHSFAFGGTAERLVLLAGRTNGLHGFVGTRQGPSFPPQYANDTVYVVDLRARKLLGQAEVTGLPPPYVNVLRSSNPQYLFDGSYLYVAGGYGPDPTSGTPVSLPYVIAVDHQALVTAVTAGTPLDAAFAATNMANFAHPALAITGGDLEEMGGQALLVYGHRFDGEYTVTGGQQVFQEYSNSVRVFTLAASRGAGGVTLAVRFLGSVPSATLALDPDNPFHRRDLNVANVMSPAGEPRIGVFGGVFKGGRMEGYVNPIYISPGPTLGLTVTPDTTGVQLLSQYDCADVQLFSASRSAMYTTLFGGISQYYWDPACSCLRRDAVDLNVPGKPVDGLPFVSSVSTFRVDGAGSAQFLHTADRFPPAGGAPTCPAASGGPVPANFLGAESKFIPATGVPAFPNGVLQLDAIAQKTVLGYLVGGIAASCPPGGDDALRCYASGAPPAGSCASSLLYQVTIDPTVPTATVRLQAPAS